MRSFLFCLIRESEPACAVKGRGSSLFGKTAPAIKFCEFEGFNSIATTKKNRPHKVICSFMVTHPGIEPEFPA